MAAEFERLLSRRSQITGRIRDELDSLKQHVSYVSILPYSVVDPENYASILAKDGTLVGSHYTVIDRHIIGWVPTIYIPFLASNDLVQNISYITDPPKPFPPKKLKADGKVVKISRQRHS